MTDLFPDLFAEVISPDPTANLLPYDGIVNDFGTVLDDAEYLYQALLQELPWQADVVTLFGKTHVTTRKIVWMGDAKRSYHYSGHTRQSTVWHPKVVHIKQRIEHRLAEAGVATKFNSCLLNWYPTGMDGMGYHADDEREMGMNPVIASVSLGATRKFAFKHNVTKETVALPLHAGQLIVMRGETQRHWKHSITKTKKVPDGRISLTFRKIMT